LLATLCTTPSGDCWQRALLAAGSEETSGTGSLKVIREESCNCLKMGEDEKHKYYVRNKLNEYSGEEKQTSTKAEKIKQ
jgi:hypothetical protein